MCQNKVILRQIALSVVLLFICMRATGGVVVHREYIESGSFKDTVVTFEDKPVVGRSAAYPLALKTNLLFDVVGAPNLGVELSLGGNRKFSVAADVAYAYWQINNLYALQTIQGGVEAKYWFRPSERSFTGWNTGVYGMYCNRYDVQWKDGYQGDGFWSAGISAGYSMPISKRLNLEFAIAGGYFYTPEVRHYHRPENGHLLWEETRYNVGRVSLTKLKVNLVWLIGRKK